MSKLPVPPHPKWSEAAFRGAIVAAIKKVWHRHPTRIEALKNAEVRVSPPTKSGKPSKRDLVFYTCAECGSYAKTIGNKDYPKVHVDHIEPVIPIESSDLSWETYLTRLFCPLENLQVLCAECHKVKTKEENSKRRLHI